jgi:hypothetical protein
VRPIIYDEWKNLGQTWETGDDLPEDDVLYVCCDHIDSLFRNFGDRLGYKTIVSAASDYGVSYQNDYPPEDDLRRWFPMQPLKGIGYRDLYMPARMNQSRCLSSDKYAIRSYSWMNATFSSIPDCKWFCTNSEVNNIKIPFGIDMESWALIQKYKDLPKQDRVFCCWENNTNERARYRANLRGVGGFVFFDKLDKEEFIYELSSSKFCFCPEGNGKDSYRICQSLYSGTIPLLVPNSWSPYGNLVGLINMETMNISVDKQTDSHLIDFDYWSKQLT